MQIRKTYREVSPELLYDEIRDFIQKQGAVLADAKLETYSLPSDSSTFVSRGTLSFRGGGPGREDSDCIRVHVVGSARNETKVMLDIDERLFPADKLQALQSDLDFIFGSYEVKAR